MEKKKTTKKSQKSEQDLIIQNIVAEVKDDFFRRQQVRRGIEAKWKLNINYFLGNQYCDINQSGEITDYEKKFFWQQQESYNHIVTVVESRLARLSRIRPKINVYATTNYENDVKTAKISNKILNSVYNSEEVAKVIAETTRWSEVCGTAFYKVIWNSNLGKNVLASDALKTGDVEVLSISPFEIYPDNSAVQNIEDMKSIIHARAYHKDQIKNMWGVDVDGEDVEIFSLNSATGAGFGGVQANSVNQKDYALVIERYEAPSVKYPNGRLIIVAGDKLVHIGELPYANAEDGKRAFPFIKQDAFTGVGSFWGNSIIERLIPVQRAYNAVKNRKHEFLNRSVIGVLAVEDGSVDVDNLEEDGLHPGKVLVYRQGANLPKYMDNQNVPCDFIEEEKAILEEFTAISGVSDTFVDAISKQISGTALQLIIEQDDNRMFTTSDNIRFAVKKLGKQILRLYKQFASVPRLCKVIGENGNFELLYFTKNDISTDDITVEVTNDSNESLTQRRQMIFNLLEKGIFTDDDGKIPTSTKTKIIETLGFADFETTEDINLLHQKRASQENYDFVSGQKPEIKSIDDHKIHIQKHTAFVIGEGLKSFDGDKAKLENLIIAHINEHKKLLNK